MTDRIGTYTTGRFAKARRNMSVMLDYAKKGHVIHALIELDVTDGKKRIRSIRERTGMRLSFTGWIVKCIAQTVSEYPEFNTYRQGRRKVITFADVDVALPVERVCDGEVLPRAYIIRRANEKSVREITEEIRGVQHERIDRSTQVLGQPLTRFERFALDAPVFMKKMLLAAFKNNALMKKKHFGTCGVTSIGTVPHFQGWNIAIGGTYTLQVGVGGITEKPVAIDGNVEIRECLGMDVAVDHDIVDGAPMARFTTRLRELVGNCFGLDDISQG